MQILQMEIETNLLEKTTERCNKEVKKLLKKIQNYSFFEIIEQINV